MKQVGAIYLSWMLGVLSAGAVAYWYWVRYLSDGAENQ